MPDAYSAIVTPTTPFNPVLLSPSTEPANSLESAVISTLVRSDIPPLLYLRQAPHPGVYIHWARRNFTGVAYYRIERARYPDSGVWESVASIQFPVNEYIDPAGSPSFFYRVEEVSPQFESLGFSAPFPAAEQLIFASLIYNLGELYCPGIEVLDEEATFNRDRTKARFGHENWSYDPKPEIRISGFNIDGDRDSTFILDENEAIFSTTPDGNDYPDGLLVRPDYNGNVSFIDKNGKPVSLKSYDEIKASYRVQIFSSTQMNHAMHMALMALNAQPGTVKYLAPEHTPPFYDTALITGAAFYLFQQMMRSMFSRKTRLLFGDPEGSGGDTFKSTEWLKDIMKSYEDPWKEFLKSVPQAYYPRIYSVVVPEMMVPGGRSRMFRQAWSGGNNR